MKNLSPLLLANHSVVEDMVKALYEDSMVVQDDTGEEHLLFISHYRGRKVYFDEKGALLLYRAAIAFFLDISKQNINRSISRLENAGFFAQYPKTVIHLITVIHGQSSKRPIPFYNSHIISLIASRIIRPSQEVIDFLMFREKMLTQYQEVLMNAVAQAYQQGYADGLAVQQPSTPSPIMALPSVAVTGSEDLPTLAEQWSQMIQQVQVLTEQVSDLHDRFALMETNQQSLLAKNEELARFNEHLVTDNLILHDIRITKERQIAERAAAKKRREDHW